MKIDKYRDHHTMHVEYHTTHENLRLKSISVDLNWKAIHGDAEATTAHGAHHHVHHDTIQIETGAPTTREEVMNDEIPHVEEHHHDQTVLCDAEICLIIQTMTCT